MTCLDDARRSARPVRVATILADEPGEPRRRLELHTYDTDFANLSSPRYRWTDWEGREVAQSGWEGYGSISEAEEALYREYRLDSWGLRFGAR